VETLIGSHCGGRRYANPAIPHVGVHHAIFHSQPLIVGSSGEREIRMSFRSEQSLVMRRFLQTTIHATGARSVVALGSLATGAALLVASSYVHFRLWSDFGYRHIPTIGDLFVLQSIAGVLMAILVLTVRRVWASILAAGFALSTLAGFVISVQWGLFGFKDSSSAPFAHVAFALEAIAALLLALSAALCWGARGARKYGPRKRHRPLGEKSLSSDRTDRPVQRTPRSFTQASSTGRINAFGGCDVRVASVRR
jgi:hypothetical protein